MDILTNELQVDFRVVARWIILVKGSGRYKLVQETMSC